MRPHSLFLGALMVAPTCGAVASLDINTVPRLRHQHVAASAPRHAVTRYEAVQQAAVTPDHYPLITPRGRVEVQDLWMHDARPRARYEDYAVYEPLQDAYASDSEPAAELQLAADEEAGGNGAMQPAPGPAGAAPTGRTSGSAKIIDVAAALASSGPGVAAPAAACHDPSNACGAKDVMAAGPRLAQAE